MSLEFELPLFSFIFILMLFLYYSIKPKVDLPENKYFEIILVCSLIESIINTVIHFICAFNDFNTIVLKYYSLFNFLNRALVIMFAIIFSALMCYTIIISYDKFRQQGKKINRYFIVGNIIFSFFTLFTNIELIEAGNVINVKGSTFMLGYFAVTVLVIISMIIALINIKKFDKRYFPIFLILAIVSVLAGLTFFFPEIIIYDVAIAIFCYIMFFTIENPDVKMIEQLEVARDQANKANQAKTDFLSSMSHEIRTPLNAIVGFSDCINNSSNLEEAKENAKDIINASNTLLEIVNGILDISKIEAGKLEITNSKYNARSTFEELAKLITPKMNEKGLDFSYYIAPDLPSTLYGDHANIKKVITNILSNAAKYTEKGFVRYEVNCVNSGNICKLIISVEDSGRGIKQENIDKLFTKFQRLEEDRNTTIEGTGLGLAITKQLTELMGGKIIVHTVYGQGSKFTVVLPQPIEKEEVKVVEETVKTTLDLKDVKILLVDDNTLNLKVATKLLQRFNANNVTCLEDGFKCLSEIESGKSYDVILLDDMMPKMSGVETLKKLKQIPNFNIPVIALTANAITGMREKYLSEGFNEYLAKPIEKEELIKVMNKILEGKKIQEYHQAKVEPSTVTPEEKTTDNTVEELLSVTEELTPINEEKIQEIEKVPVEPKAIINREEDAVELKKKFLMSKGIDLDKSLELLGDMEMYDMTLNDFVSEADNKWLRIKNYKQIADMKNYAIEVHSLKSDSKYLGFMRLADISYQHELKSKDSDINFVNNHFKELEAEYSRIRSIIDEYQSLDKETF